PGPVSPGASPLVVPRARAPGLQRHVSRSLDAAPKAADPFFVAARRAVFEFLGDQAHGLLLEGEDAGDWKMDRLRVGNLEYDTALGLAEFGFLARDPVAMNQARASADHLLAFDRDAASSGLFFVHGASHRSGGLEAGHHWIGGLALLDRADGDPLRR